MHMQVCNLYDIYDQLYRKVLLVLLNNRAVKKTQNTQDTAQPNLTP